MTDGVLLTLRLDGAFQDSLPNMLAEINGVIAAGSVEDGKADWFFIRLAQLSKRVSVVYVQHRANEETANADRGESDGSALASLSHSEAPTGGS